MLRDAVILKRRENKDNFLKIIKDITFFFENRASLNLFKKA